MGREKPEINRYRISPLPANVPYSLALFLICEENNHEESAEKLFSKRKICCSTGLYSILSSFSCFFFLRPFSFSPKKKGQKERRRSNAAGLLFHEYPHGRNCSSVAYKAVRCTSTVVLNGITWKSPNTTTGRSMGKSCDSAPPPHHHRAREGKDRPMGRDLPPFPLPRGRGELSSTEDFSPCSPRPLGEGAGG